MLYISGVQALNLPCSLNTPGDWHLYGIVWDPLDLRDSEQSIFKEYGIEDQQKLPYHTEQYPVANHIRAVLDLLSSGQFGLVQGMRRNFICTDEYDPEIFDKVLMLKNGPNWEKISKFMEREYMLKWLNFLEKKMDLNMLTI